MRAALGYVLASVVCAVLLVFFGLWLFRMRSEILAPMG